MRLGISFVFGALALMSFTLVGTAPAQAIPFGLKIYADGGQIADIDQDDMGCIDNPDGVSAHCSATGLTYGSSYTAISLDLELDIDSDPVVTGTTTVTNVFTATQHFTLIFTLPVDPMPDYTRSGGSYRGTVRDLNGDGAELETADPITEGGFGALYTALLDGNDWQDLYLHPASHTAGANATTTMPTQEFGTPIPSLIGPPVATSIGIRLDFNLTASDRASIVSNHVVIPEPHTGALMAIGLALLAMRRRH